ncbi:hypothetical protein DCAR_0209284 [Daucus carota subsp. sativus]|uniref:Phylloplanin n=1 Tax=Daucus carota subsp. sativus TaxID=79200 RepID=A0A166F5P5_DAUCS|nr:hypothetical protein DCAR_0209284 [Daucus carota subsp. sativus]
MEAGQWIRELDRNMDQMQEGPVKLVIFVSTLVLLLGSLPQGQGVVQPQATGLIQIFEIQFSGILACTPTGNPPSTGDVVPGVVGAVFSGSCNGASGNISQFLIDQNGAFSGVLSLLDGILFDPSQGMPCFISVQLPVTGTTCTVLPPTGTLRAALNLVSLVVSLAGNLVCVAIIGPWGL